MKDVMRKAVYNNKTTLIGVFMAIAVAIGPFIPRSAGEAEIPFAEKHNDKSCIFILYSVNVKVNSDWSYETEVHKKIKILKDDAKGMGEIPVYYEKDREEIVSLESVTIAPDGKEYGPTGTQDLNVYGGYPMYSNAMVRVLTLPEVTVGSVIDHKCKIVSKGLAVKNCFWYLYNLMTDVPIQEQAFSITMPKSLGIKYKEFALTTKPVITETPTEITYSWTVKDMDADDEGEDYLPPPTPESCKESFEFSSIADWKGVSDWFGSLIRKNLEITPAIRDTALRLTKDKISARDKTRAILEYVQKDFRYVSMSFGDNALEPHPTGEVFANKYGDCKDLSLLCKAMLSAAGVASDLCLFNTEYAINDPKSDLPIPTLFNHVLLSVKDDKEGDFFADPLLDGYDIGEYPAAYQMAYVFIVTEDGGRFARFPVFGEENNCNRTHSVITIARDGSAVVEVDTVWDLESSVQNRAMLKSMNNQQKKKFYESLDTMLASDGEMIKREITGFDRKYGALKGYSKTRQRNSYPATGDLLIIDIGGFTRGLEFTEAKRKNPIFNPINSLIEEVTTYRVPKGYSVYYMPPDLKIDNGFASVSRKYEKTADGIKVTEMTRFKRVQLPSTDYDKLKKFYDTLPSTTGQRIVFKIAK